jgi:hypothetical protein
VTKARKVTACQGVFKRSLNVMKTEAVNGVLNIGVEKNSSLEMPDLGQRAITAIPT